MTFADLVADELTKARALHADMTNCHEAFAVIYEELDEFWEEVRKKSRLRTDAAMLKELVQTAAMCQRAAEDLGLV